jgi:hypothetical protein
MLLEEEGKYEVTLIAEDTFEEESKKRGELKVSFVINKEKFEWENVHEEEYYHI